MKKIREVIVVEGKHDTATLKKYFDCETIETSGSSVPDYIIERIKKAKERCGVIVFTDPDAPGNMIRARVNEAVPGCKNAFVDKKNAHTTHKVGIEHADEKTLREALEHLITYDASSGTLTMQDLYALGLTGRENSSFLRRKVGEILHIGYGTAGTMLKRLNHLGIQKEELEKMI